MSRLCLKTSLFNHKKRTRESTCKERGKEEALNLNQGGCKHGKDLPSLEEKDNHKPLLALYSSPSSFVTKEEIIKVKIYTLSIFLAPLDIL